MNSHPLNPPQQGSDKPPSSSKLSGSPGSKTSSRHCSSHSSSGSSTNFNGHALLSTRLRSLLSHDLALPLFHALQGSDPGKQSYLPRESRSMPDGCGDSIFENAVREWVSQPQRTEPQLTHSLSKLINDVSEQTLLQSDNAVEVTALCTSQQEAHLSARIDILLSSPNDKSPSKPLALIQVGCKNQNWWKKLDRAGKYLDIMDDNSMDEKIKFQNAMICAVLTLEGEDNTKEFQSQFGIFLCWPIAGKRFRMARLWNARTHDLSALSKDFGRFLRVVSSFAVWLEDGPPVDYEYLSRNVCRVGNMVSRLPSCGTTLWGLWKSCS